MACFSGTNIVSDGLILCIDAANYKYGSSPYKNLHGAGNSTNQNFTIVDGIFRTDADPVTGAGTSELLTTGIEINTGSFSLTNWLKVTSEPNVGTNNNYRMIFAQNGISQSPFGFLMEQNRSIQYTLVTSTRTYRYLNGYFTQGTLPLNEWAMSTFQYEKSTGIASVYYNGSLVRSGPMSTDTAKTLTSVPNEPVINVTTSMYMNLSNNNPTTNPNGQGCFPGDMGPCLLYNKSLSDNEVKQNFESIRGRYGV